MGKLLGRVYQVAALLGVVAVCLLNVCAHVRVVPPPEARQVTEPSDWVSEFEHRMQPVRSALSERGVRGAVGYLSDTARKARAGGTDATVEYFLAEYVLVPIILSPDLSGREWCVVNLRSTTLAECLPAGWRVEKDFGAGVALLRKAAP